jgi:trimeric autotransporter adhesin
MASTAIVHEYSAEKLTEEFHIATVVVASTDPAFQLTETTTNQLCRMRLEPSDGSIVFETNDGAGGGWIDAGELSTGSSGDVVGPGSSTDNALARFDSTTGKLIQNSNAILADNGGLSLTAAAASEVLGSFTAHASQTANLTEWKSSGGTVGAHVTESQAFHNTGGGTNSCVYGDGAGVDGNEPNCTSVGVNAICYGDDAVAIGYGATAGGSGSTAYQDNVAIGSGALSVISSGVAIGAGATTGSSGSSTAIGALASVTGNSSVAIGAGATVTGAFGVVIGQGTSSTGSGVTIGRSATGANAIGYNADSSGHAQAQAWGTSCVAGAIGAVAMGYAANASHSGAICIGDRATSTAAYQLVIGSDYLSGSVKINDVYIGEGVTSASPDGVTINSTGGKGTDIAGSDITIAGGKGTGSAAGGEIIFSTSNAGVTGTTLRSLTEKARIDVSGNFSAVGTLNIGTGHTVSGTLACVPGGLDNLADGVVSVAMGDKATTRTMRGAVAHASGSFATDGDAQRRDVVLRRQTTTDTFLSLTADGGADSATDSLQIPNNSCMRITGTVTGYLSTGAKVATYTVKALVKRVSAVTTLAYNSVTADFEDDATWDCQVIVYSSGVAIQAKGGSGETVNWVAELRTGEVG